MTNRQTDRQTDHATLSIATDCILCHAMRPNINEQPRQFVASMNCFVWINSETEGGGAGERVGLLVLGMLSAGS